MIKNHRVRVLALLSILVLCIGMTGAALATTATPPISTRASYYLSDYDAWVNTSGSRKVDINFDVDATGDMDLLGASCIVIQKKVGSSWTWAYTYNGSVANGMLVEDEPSYMSYVTYTGTSGTEYRALVTIYAEDGSGYDLRTVTTGSVVAP